MFLLTRKAILKCAHGGVVNNVNSQDWVRVDDDPLLIENDPRQRSISGCPMLTITTPPCTSTVSVDDASYSAFVRIDGKRVCLDSTSGRTNWSQLGITPFSVTSVAQKFVSSGG